MGYSIGKYSSKRLECYIAKVFHAVRNKITGQRFCSETLHAFFRGFARIFRRHQVLLQSKTGIISPVQSLEHGVFLASQTSRSSDVTLHHYLNTIIKRKK